MADAGSRGSAEVRSVRARLLVDADHYTTLTSASGAVATATVSVWIATANLKSMLVEAPIGTRARARGRYVSFFTTLSELADRGVDVRVLHAAPPSRPLAAELGRATSSTHPGGPRGGHRGGVALRQCPRVHLKMIAVDGRHLYLGSANMTGAGLGAKGDGRRNFELGILTDNDVWLDAAQERFDRIWRGAECKSCKLRRECPRPLDLPAPGPVTSPAGSRRGSRSPSSPR
jgi:phosphatidylserine/phosphatidylglycerophosphate/cardiolipin synthase-like enzyme